MNRRRATSRKAFTLLEVLVAMTMAAVLAGSLYATLSAAFRARKAAQAEVADFRRAEFAAEFVCAELREAVVPNGILAGTFYGEDNDNSDTVEFYRVASVNDQDIGQGDIMMVNLECEPSPTGAGMDLVRRVRRNLLAPTFYDMPGQVLCRGVTSFNLQYYDGTELLNSWDSSTMDNSLPIAITVDISVTADEDVPGNLLQDAAVLHASHTLWLPASTLEVGTQMEVTQ